MKKTIDQRLDEMLIQLRNGTVELLPCDSYVTNRDPAELKKRIDELKRLNELPLEAKRTARASRSAHTRPSKKPRRTKLGISKHPEKLSKAK